MAEVSGSKPGQGIKGRIRTAVIFRNPCTDECYATQQLQPVQQVQIGNEIYSVDQVYGFDSIGRQALEDEVSTVLVPLAFKGADGAIMAYGPSGSGKTTAVLGGILSQGIVSTVLSSTYAYRKGLQASDCSVAIYLESEEIYKAPSQKADRRMSFGAPLKASSSLAEAAPKAVDLPTLEDAQRRFQSLVEKRTVKATALNQTSSRSHLLLTLTVKVQEPYKHPRIGSILMVDLAGSERLKDTGAEGETAEEAKVINSDLSYLGAALKSLTEGRVTGWRDCELTRQLKPYLAGNASVLVLGCIDPRKPDDAKNTLRFLKTAGAASEFVTVNKPSTQQTLVKAEQERDEALMQLGAIRAAISHNEILQGLLIKEGIDLSRMSAGPGPGEASTSRPATSAAPRRSSMCPSTARGAARPPLPRPSAAVLPTPSTSAWRHAPGEVERQAAGASGMWVAGRGAGGGGHALDSGMVKEEAAQLTQASGTSLPTAPAGGQPEGSVPYMAEWQPTAGLVPNAGLPAYKQEDAEGCYEPLLPALAGSYVEQTYATEHKSESPQASAAPGAGSAPCATPEAARLAHGAGTAGSRLSFGNVSPSLSPPSAMAEDLWGQLVRRGADMQLTPPWTCYGSSAFGFDGGAASGVPATQGAATSLSPTFRGIDSTLRASSRADGPDCGATATKGPGRADALQEEHARQTAHPEPGVGMPEQDSLRYPLMKAKQEVPEPDAPPGPDNEGERRGGQTEGLGALPQQSHSSPSQAVSEPARAAPDDAAAAAIPALQPSGQVERTQPQSPQREACSPCYGAHAGGGADRLRCSSTPEPKAAAGADAAEGPDQAPCGSASAVTATSSLSCAASLPIDAASAGSLPGRILLDPAYGGDGWQALLGRALSAPDPVGTCDALTEGALGTSTPEIPNVGRAVEEAPYEEPASPGASLTLQLDDCDGDGPGYVGSTFGTPRGWEPPPGTTPLTHMGTGGMTARTCSYASPCDSEAACTAAPASDPADTGVPVAPASPRAAALATRALPADGPSGYHADVDAWLGPEPPWHPGARTEVKLPNGAGSSGDSQGLERNHDLQGHHHQRQHARQSRAHSHGNEDQLHPPCPESFVCKGLSAPQARSLSLSPLTNGTQHLSSPLSPAAAAAGSGPANPFRGAVTGAVLQPPPALATPRAAAEPEQERSAAEQEQLQPPWRQQLAPMAPGPSPDAAPGVTPGGRMPSQPSVLSRTPPLSLGLGLLQRLAGRADAAQAGAAPALAPGPLQAAPSAAGAVQAHVSDTAAFQGPAAGSQGNGSWEHTAASALPTGTTAGEHGRLHGSGAAAVAAVLSGLPPAPGPAAGTFVGDGPGPTSQCPPSPSSPSLKRYSGAVPERGGPSATPAHDGARTVRVDVTSAPESQEAAQKAEHAEMAPAGRAQQPPAAAPAPTPIAAPVPPPAAAPMPPQIAAQVQPPAAVLPTARAHQSPAANHVTPPAVAPVPAPAATGVPPRAAAPVPGAARDQVPPAGAGRMTPPRMDLSHLNDSEDDANTPIAPQLPQLRPEPKKPKEPKKAARDPRLGPVGPRMKCSKPTGRRLSLAPRELLNAGNDDGDDSADETWQPSAQIHSTKKACKKVKWTPEQMTWLEDAVTDERASGQTGLWRRVEERLLRDMASLTRHGLVVRTEAALKNKYNELKGKASLQSPVRVRSAARREAAA